jgi:outer membrane receptor protein involved in Fe transport
MPAIAPLTLLAASVALAEDASSPDLMSVPRTYIGALPEGTHEEIIVTAQRREESAQRVPIALSAFTQSDLDNAGIPGGPNLQLAIPNVSFSSNEFFGSNFQIRGIGTQLVNTTADPATGIHVNQSPLVRNDLFESLFYDLERVEVLRGPQGTLYGRNATGGVVNVVTAKPSAELEGLGQVEVGKSSEDKVQGFINIPLIGDQLGMRLAGFLAGRSGIARNQANGDKVDGRELASGRFTLAYVPSDRLNAYVLWQRFSENDSRSRFAKTLCTHDPGPATVAGVNVDALDRNFLSQGCKATSIYGADVFGAPNSAATLPGLLGLKAGVVTGDTNSGLVQSPDLRTMDMWRDPSFTAHNDLGELNVTWRPADFLQVTSLGSYAQQNTQSRNYSPLPGIAFLSTPLTPGGAFNDPQTGASNLPLTFQVQRENLRQYNGELRLESLFLGPLNFELGANYLHYQDTTDAFFLSNQVTALAVGLNKGAPCPAALSANCIFIDPNPDPTGNGHNYFDLRTPYTLQSEALFGEVYYKLLPNLKLTAGARYTRDIKDMDNIPNVLLAVSSAAAGRQPGFPPVVRFSSSQPTGRLGLDWQPDLSFTDHTLLYAFYSRGYQGGGINFNSAMNTAAVPAFQPELVDSFEIGTKNSLLGDRLQVNLTAFHYGYRNYQINNIINRAAVIQNVDARVSGLELETAWKPTQALRLALTAGLLDTAITKGSATDPFNATNGDPTLTLVKNPVDGSNCVAPTAGVARVQSLINSGALAPGALLGICSGAFQALGATPTDGVAVPLNGRQLPNAPQWTASFDAAYTRRLSEGWNATARANFYARAQSYARIYNSTADLIRGWTNTNAQLEFASKPWNFAVTLYGRNIFNQSEITTTALTDPALGLTRELYMLDARTYGVMLTKGF